MLKKIEKTVCALLACLLCLSGSMAVGEGIRMQITPLAEMEAQEGPLYYQKALFDTGLSVMLRITMSSQVVEDSPEFRALLFMEPELPDVTFAYFTIYAPELADADMGKLTEEEIWALMDYISNEPEKIIYSVEKDFVDGVAVLHMNEQRTQRAHHTITVQGEWIINLMVINNEMGGSIGKEALAMQRDLYQMALWGDWFRPTHTLEIPGTTMRLELPEGLLFRMYEEEDDFLNGGISRIAKPDIGMLSFHAVMDPAYEGHTTLTMEEETIEVMLENMALTESFQSLVNNEFAEGLGAMAQQDGAATRVFFIRDGWMVMMTLLHALDVDQDAAFILMCSVLESLALDGSLPISVPEALR